MNESKATSAGLYIHIPFCTRKCAYCDFFSVTDLSLINAFVDAVICEMELLRDSPLAFDTIYLGGGTPSVVPPGHISRLIKGAVGHFDFGDDVEITIEVNPGTADRQSMLDYRQAGVNRINIGVQSFSNTALRFLSRIHTADEAAAAITHARRAGFLNLGLDLIYGLPGQSPDDWQKDLEHAVGFSPEHLSCYTLTYEKGTPLGKMKADGQVEPLDDDAVADLFKVMQNVLSRHGYEQYEIANFAKMPAKAETADQGTSFRSRHNQKYWTPAPYIGLGPSAHSFVEPERRWNVADLHTYLARLEEGVLPIEASEILTQEQRLTETLYLKLRTREGIDIPRLEHIFGLDFEERYGNVIKDFIQEDLLAIDDQRCFLTPRGMRFLDGIVEMLLNQRTELQKVKR